MPYDHDDYYDRHVYRSSSASTPDNVYYNWIIYGRLPNNIDNRSDYPSGHWRVLQFRFHLYSRDIAVRLF